ECSWETEGEDCRMGTPANRRPTEQVRSNLRPAPGTLSGGVREVMPLAINYGTRVRNDARGASETKRPESAKVCEDRVPRLGVVNEPDLAAIGPEATAEGGVSVFRALRTSACAHMSRRPTRARQRPLFLRAMPTYSSNARKSPRRKEAISPTPAPVWRPNLTTRCPLCFDCPPGETSRFPLGKLANMSEVTQILAAIGQG